MAEPLFPLRGALTPVSLQSVFKLVVRSDFIDSDVDPVLLFKVQPMSGRERRRIK